MRRRSLATAEQRASSLPRPVLCRNVPQATTQDDVTSVKALLDTRISGEPELVVGRLENGMQ